MSNIDIRSLARETIQQLVPYKSARHEFKRENKMVFLDANENPYGFLNRYPDPMSMRLKTIIAENDGVNTNQIIIGNGSGEIINFLTIAFCEPKTDNIIIMPPTFGLFALFANTYGIKLIQVPLRKSDFQMDYGLLQRLVEPSSKLIFITTPNNPTGNSFRIDDVIRILDIFPGIVVIDEAYVEFSKVETYVKLLNKYPKLFVIRTFSKAYGLAGLRIGIGYGHPDIIHTLHKLKPPYNIGQLNQQTAIDVLKDRQSVDMQVTKLIEYREKLVERLSKIRFIRTIYPSDSNFILVKVDDASLRYKQLIDRGIVVRNTSSYLNCENTFRITVGSRSENIKLCDALLSMENRL